MSVLDEISAIVGPPVGGWKNVKIRANDKGHPVGATVTHGSLELRFQLDMGDVWILDEIVGECWMHVEQMSADNYWMGLHPKGEGVDRLMLNFRYAPRKCVRLDGWVD